MPELWIVSACPRLSEHIFFHIWHNEHLLSCINNMKIHWVFARINLPNTLPIAPENIHILDIVDETPLSVMSHIRRRWFYHADDDLHPCEDVDNPRWWLYLEPSFFNHNFNQNFWSDWGKWLVASYQDLCTQSKNHHPITRMLALVHPLLHPDNLRNLAKLKTDFRQFEFAASCTIWNAKWLKHTGLWMDQLWGNWTEWVLRGSILATNHFYTSSRQRAIQNATARVWTSSVNSSVYISPDLSPGVSHPSIGKTTAYFPHTIFPKSSSSDEYCPPAIIEKGWADWSWGAICVYYGIRHPVNESPNKWSDIVPAWDQIQTYAPQTYPISFPINSAFCPEITIAMTACIRPFIFRRTLETFIKYTTDLKKFKIRWIIHVDIIPKQFSSDSMIQTFFEAVNPVYYNNDKHNVQWIICSSPGFARAFRQVILHVQTDFVFYLQDDWEFMRPFFLENLIVPMIPYHNLIIGVHLFKLDGGTNAKQDLLYLSPCMMKTSAWKLLMPWIIPGYDPEQLLRPHGTNNPRGNFWILNTQFIGKCHSPCGEQVMVRDLGRPWMQQMGIYRNNQVNPVETFNHWIIR